MPSRSESEKRGGLAVRGSPATVIENRSSQGEDDDSDDESGPRHQDQRRVSRRMAATQQRSGSVVQIKIDSRSLDSRFQVVRKQDK